MEPGALALPFFPRRPLPRPRPPPIALSLDKNHG